MLSAPHRGSPDSVDRRKSGSTTRSSPLTSQCKGPQRGASKSLVRFLSGSSSSSTDLSVDWHNRQQMGSQCGRVLASLKSYQMHMWEEGADPSNDVMDGFTEPTDDIRAANPSQSQRDQHGKAANQIHLSSCKPRLVQKIQEMGLAIIASRVCSPKLCGLIIDQSHRKANILYIIDKEEHAEQADQRWPQRQHQGQQRHTQPGRGIQPEGRGRGPGQYPYQRERWKGQWQGRRQRQSKGGGKRGNCISSNLVPTMGTARVEATEPSSSQAQIPL